MENPTFRQLYKAYLTFIKTYQCGWFKSRIHAIAHANNALKEESYWILCGTAPTWCTKCAYIYPLILKRCPICNFERKGDFDES